MTTPLPLTAVLIRHADHWTGWIAELPEVEHVAPTRAAVTAALPGLARAALAARAPDLAMERCTVTPRPRRPAPRGAMGRLRRRIAHHGKGRRSRTPRLDMLRTSRSSH